MLVYQFPEARVMFRYPLELVTIDGFRGLRNLCLEQFGRINILVGPNNSGKTSVLEALSVFCNAIDPMEWLRMVRRRDRGGMDETRIQSLRWCFAQGGGLAGPNAGFEGRCTFECGGATSLRSVRADYREIQEELTRVANRDRKFDGGSLPEPQRSSSESILDVEPRLGAEITHRIEFGDPFLLGPRTKGEPIVLRVWEEYPVLAEREPPSQKPLLAATLTPSSYKIDRAGDQCCSCYETGADRNVVLGLIREFDHAITDIKEVSFHGLRPAIHVTHERLGVAPLSVFGDALQRAVVLAETIISLRDGGILLIDELETGVHVSVLERLCRWVARVSAQMNVQVVATTQSLEAIDAMARATAGGYRELVAFHLDQTAEETRVKRMEADLLVRLRSERAGGCEVSHVERTRFSKSGVVMLGTRVTPRAARRREVRAPRRSSFRLAASGLRATSGRRVPGERCRRDFRTIQFRVTIVDIHQRKGGRDDTMGG